MNSGIDILNLNWNDYTINILYYPATNEYQPYRFLGRKLELGAWRSRPTNSQYIKELSAIRPFAKVDNLDNEKIAFAGFYPNCRSVFGFHDGDFTTNTTPPKDLRYDVIGWYSDAAILILKSNKWYRQKQSFKQATKCAPASATASQRSEYIEYLYSKYLKDGINLEQKFSTSEREPNKNWWLLSVEVKLLSWKY